MLCVQDKDETRESLSRGTPVVSFSLGDTADFAFGESNDEVRCVCVCVCMCVCVTQDHPCETELDVTNRVLRAVLSSMRKACSHVHVCASVCSAYTGQGACGAASLRRRVGVWRPCKTHIPRGAFETLCVFVCVYLPCFMHTHTHTRARLCGMQN